ncbi:hypothetical protein [Nocardia asteroides]|uniref:hypothetical protein n=1 Tax=Nocardia asteroides TaxID=1824 RepID=UPI001E4E95E8|nr:hypothetical protein [Nocardia asteroides]UGT61781.1 hypothetical protein LTT61_32565 [Nocardia asteroides]
MTFAMSNWVGDNNTVSCLEALATRGFPISMVTPGPNPEAVRADIAALGPAYDQVVIFGYPPFVRDVLDGAGPAVLSQDLKILLSGENISERWRERLLKLIAKPGKPTDTYLISSIADVGLVEHDMPSTIVVRRLAASDPRLREQLFGAGQALPILVEVDPHYRYTETDDTGRLHCAPAGPVPLVRYRMGDEARRCQRPASSPPSGRAAVTCECGPACLGQHS